MRDLHGVWWCCNKWWANEQVGLGWIICQMQVDGYLLCIIVYCPVLQDLFLPDVSPSLRCTHNQSCKSKPSWFQAAIELENLCKVGSTQPGGVIQSLPNDVHLIITSSSLVLADTWTFAWLYSCFGLLWLCDRMMKSFRVSECWFATVRTRKLR